MVVSFCCVIYVSVYVLFISYNSTFKSLLSLLFLCYCICLGTGQAQETVIVVNVSKPESVSSSVVRNIQLTFRLSSKYPSVSPSISVLGDGLCQQLCYSLSMAIKEYSDRLIESPMILDKFKCYFSSQKWLCLLMSKYYKSFACDARIYKEKVPRGRFLYIASSNRILLPTV